MIAASGQVIAQVAKQKADLIRKKFPGGPRVSYLHYILYLSCSTIFCSNTRVLVLSTAMTADEAASISLMLPKSKSPQQKFLLNLNITSMKMMFLQFLPFKPMILKNHAMLVNMILEICPVLVTIVMIIRGMEQGTIKCVQNKKECT